MGLYNLYIVSFDNGADDCPSIEIINASEEEINQLVEGYNKTYHRGYRRNVRHYASYELVNPRSIEDVAKECGVKLNRYLRSG